MRNWLINTEPKRPEYYEGLLIHADTGMHDQAMALFRQYVPAGSSVLDIGAGAGAFSRRLKNATYAVTALDVDPDKWLSKDIRFVRLDIDAGIAASIGERMDAACCLEVIEHVENPWNLLREAAAVLKPHGRLILSTPNVTSFLSRLIFLRTGQFHQFRDADLSYGHISPITPFELTTIASRLGWRILEIRPGGYLPVFDLATMRPKTLVLDVLRGLAYLVARNHKRGWCLFFVLEKLA